MQNEALCCCVTERVIGENWRWVVVGNNGSSDVMGWPLGFSGTSVTASVDIRLVGCKSVTSLIPLIGLVVDHDHRCLSTSTSQQTTQEFTI